MSTNEFENEWEDQHVDSSLLLRQELGLPEDFTDEDVAFAQEMKTLFSPDKEEMPPYYVQTLLDAENPKFQPVEHGLEYKTQARVFQRLKLRRHLFHSKSVLQSSTMQRVKPQRSIFALLAACLLFIFFTLVATGPSFASGLEVLLSGHHGGVLQVNGYPNLFHKKVQRPYLADIDPATPSKKISLLEAQQQLMFPMEGPSNVPDHYALNSMSLYQGIDQSWADGPALELDYSYMHQGAISHGIGQISVCEFKPKGQVLQVVQSGAAHPIDRAGHTQAIYVDGQWVHINKFSHEWIYGGRSEIIFEQDGIIFWIVGDQRDGIEQKALLSIANSLQPFNMHAINMVGHVDNIILSLDNSTWPFSDDIVYTNEPTGSSLEIVGTDTTSSNIHVPSNQAPPK